MNKVIDILVLLSLIYTSNHAQFVQRIVDCFFIDNDKVTSVGLICDKYIGYYPHDNCYPKLFENESGNISRSMVKELKIAGCKYKMIFSSVFEMFRNITALDVTYLGILDLKWDQNNYEYLNKINASNNALEYVFQYKGNLTEIDFSHNKIKKITSESFDDLGLLKKINLSYNSIRYITALSFLLQIHLEYIDLSHNQLENLDMEIFINGFNTLKVINLEYNKIRDVNGLSFSLSDTFDNMTYINLSNNLIFSIPEHFLYQLGPSMEYFNLSHNDLYQFINFEHSNLKTLDLSHNPQLQVFTTSTTINSTSLEILRLENCALSTLKGISNSTFPKLSQIAISKNEFSCDYATDFVQQWNNILIIGDPCDQLIYKDFVMPKRYVRFELLLFGVAVCSIVITIIVFSTWSVIVQRVEDNKLPQNLGQLEISPQSCEKCDTLTFPGKNGEEQPEPIYHEIEVMPSNFYEYDHLRFNPLPTSCIQNHYHNAAIDNGN